MAATLTLLTTRAECDEALENLTIERESYEHRSGNIDYADTVASRAATTTAARLAKATDDVARYTADAARAGITPVEKRRAQAALITATATRDRLALATTTQTGSEAYLSEVDADQIEGQVAVLTARINEVTAHRATLPA
ncbi:hypothetical protein [Hymenobacter daeguensis]